MMKNVTVDATVDLNGAQIDVLRLLKNAGGLLSSKSIFEMGSYFTNSVQAAQTCFLLKKRGLVDRIKYETGFSYQINKKGLAALEAVEGSKIDAGSWGGLHCGHTPAAYSVPQSSCRASSGDAGSDDEGVYYAVPLSRFKLKPCRTAGEAEDDAMRVSKGKPVIIIRAIEVVKRAGRFPAATLMA